MTRTLAAWLAFVMLAAFVVLWSLHMGAEPTIDPLTPSTSAAAQPTVASSDVDSGAELADSARSAVAVDASEHPSWVVLDPAIFTKDTGRPFETPTMRVVQGTLVVIDELGSAHRTESGTFAVEGVAVEPPSSPVARRDTHARWDTQQDYLVQVRRRSLVVVEDGRWSLAVDEGVGALRPSKFELGARGASLEEDRDTFAIPAEGLLDIQVRWHPKSVLHVRARGSDIELRNVELVHDACAAPGLQLAPSARGGARVLFDATRSPIELAPIPSMLSKPLEVFYARAPGYAWGRVELDMSQGGERVVELVPAGAIAVRLLNRFAEDDRFVVRLRAAGATGGQPLLERPLYDQDRISFESLAAGRYRVSVETGAAMRQRAELGSAEVEVVPGSTADVTLVLKRLVVPKLVDVRGWLVVPPEWSLKRFALIVSPVAPDASDGEDALAFTITDQQMRLLDELEAPSIGSCPGSRCGTFAWFLSELPIGKYRFSFRDDDSTIVHSVLVVVEADGPSLVRIEIPPPALVRVRAVDAQTGRDAELEELLCAVAGLERQSASAVRKVRRAPHADAFEFKMAPGNFRLCPGGDAHRREWTDVRVGRGTTELTLEVVRSFGFIVVLNDGEAVVPLGDRHAEAQRVDGDGEASSWESILHGQRVTVSAAGEYRVRVPAIEGFSPVPEQHVSVRAGEFATLSVKLERVR